jgi:hypothetical protein
LRDRSERDKGDLESSVGEGEGSFVRDKRGVRQAAAGGSGEMEEFRRGKVDRAVSEAECKGVGEKMSGIAENEDVCVWGIGSTGSGVGAVALAVLAVGNTDKGGKTTEGMTGVTGEKTGGTEGKSTEEMSGTD